MSNRIQTSQVVAIVADNNISAAELSACQREINASQFPAGQLAMMREPLARGWQIGGTPYRMHSQASSEIEFGDNTA